MRPRSTCEAFFRCGLRGKRRLSYACSAVVGSAGVFTSSTDSIRLGRDVGGRARSRGAKPSGRGIGRDAKCRIGGMPEMLDEGDGQSGVASEQAGGLVRICGK